MGAVYGTAGASLQDSSGWAANAEVAAIGARGESATAELLNRWAAHHPASVFHDLQIPGRRENIDHAILGSDTLLLIDSKVWKPGVLWTWNGVTRNGLQRIPHADKRTMPMAQDRLAPVLARAGGRVRSIRSLLVIHPSNRSSRLRLAWYSPAGDTQAVHADRFLARLARVAPRGVADPASARALAGLIART